MPNIGSKNITRDNGIYVIAEIGVNHEGSLEKAFELIRSAKAAGADGAKFQTYKAEKIASKDSPAYWDLNMEPTRNQYELFKKYDSFGEHEYLSVLKRRPMWALIFFPPLLIRMQLSFSTHLCHSSRSRQQT